MSISEIQLASALFGSAFLAATLLPTASEVFLGTLLTQYPDPWVLWLLAASAGNILGSVSTFFCGLWLRLALNKRPRKPTWLSPPNPKSLSYLHRYGSALLFMSWVPIIGDPLVFAAGWLKLPAGPCLAFMALGKIVRYGLLTYALI